jgi:uncharacterized membrane protein
MGEQSRRFDRLLGTGQNTDRMQFFSDAVFAIAMTLLVIDITVPRLDDPTDLELWRAILGEWERFFAYVLSFLVIGLNWMSHHRRFRLIPRYDSGLIRINLLLLLLVAFVPFPTSLISEYGSLVPAVVSYALTVAAIGLVQMWMWSYAFSHKLTSDEVTPELFRYVQRGQLTAPIVFLLSVPIAFLVGGYWPLYFWFLNWPLGILVGRWRAKAAG